jgi:hypothetical protein
VCAFNTVLRGIVGLAKKSCINLPNLPKLTHGFLENNVDLGHEKRSQRTKVGGGKVE